MRDYTTELRRAHHDYTLACELTMNWVESTESTMNAIRALRAREVNPYMDAEYYRVDRHEVRFTITLSDLPGLKDKRLVNLLEAIVGANPNEAGSHDYPSQMERDYVFRWREGSMSMVIRVEARIKSDSASCRRVIVGYEDAPVSLTPIYELRCD
jgi:hypothetical protein